MRKHVKEFLKKLSSNLTFAMNYGFILDIELNTDSRTFANFSHVSQLKGRVKKFLDTQHESNDDKYKICLALIHCGRAFFYHGRFVPVVEAKYVSEWRFKNDRIYAEAYQRIFDREINGVEQNVYFFVCHETNEVKIGVSNNVERRKSQIEREEGRKLYTIGVINGASFDLESRLHRRFAHIRTRNEWFEWCDEIKLFIANHATTSCDLEFLHRMRRKFLGTTSRAGYNYGKPTTQDFWSYNINITVDELPM